MRVKTKISILSAILFLVFICFFFGIKSYAAEIDYNDFSTYLNCYKNDIYTEATYIKPLTKVNYYNVGSECYAKYNLKTIEASTPKYSNIGFKVNDEFYISAYYLNETGTYKIESYFYEKNSDGYYQARGNALETFYVYVNLGFELTQNRSNFYYENYSSEAEFVEDVKNSFSEEITLTLQSQNSLKKAYESYNGETKTITITLTFKNVSYDFSVKLNPLKDAKNNFNTLTDVVEKAKEGQAYANQTNYKAGTSIKDTLSSVILKRASNNLNLAEGQKVDLEIQNDLVFKSFGSNNCLTYNFQVIASEVGTNEEIVFTIPIMIYKPEYLKNTKNYMKAEFSSDEYISGQKILNSYYTYLSFTENNTVYNDYLNTPSITSFEINEDKKTVTYSLKYGDVEVKTSETIKVVQSDAKPKIKTRYNYIVLKNKKSVDFQSQIKIECSTAYSVKYDTVDVDGEDWLNICIYDETTGETLASENVKIMYINNSNSFFLKVMKVYGDFLRKIFG